MSRCPRKWASSAIWDTPRETEAKARRSECGVNPLSDAGDLNSAVNRKRTAPYWLKQSPISRDERPIGHVLDHLHSDEGTGTSGYSPPLRA